MTELNLKSQVLKLAKGLSKFSIDDILIIIDITKEQLQEILLELEMESIIKRIGDSQYIYSKITVNKQSENLSQPKRKKPAIQKEFPPVKLFKYEKELEIYNSLPVRIQDKIYKYILLMQMTSGLMGQKLEDALIKIGNEAPEYKLCYGTLKDKQRRYMKSGIKGLIPRYHLMNRGRRFSPEIYEYFKKLYLHPRRLSMNGCIEIIRQDERFKDAQMPDRTTLRDYLKSEYSPEEIKKKRFCKVELPKLKRQKKKKKKEEKPKEKTFKYYIDAVHHYQKSREYLGKSKHIQYVQNGYFKNHLNPFFKELKFSEINTEKINQFRTQKLKEGLSLTTIAMFLGVFSIIINKYAPCEKQFVLNGANKLSDFDYDRVLSVEQIRKILNMETKIKLILLFVLSLGLSQAEILGLDHKDIDYEKQTVKITKILYKGKIEKYRREYQKRELHIPDTLFLEIPKQQEGRIFNTSVQKLDDETTKLGKVLNVENLIYEDFITFYVYFLIENNIQVNLISKNLAYGDIKDFLKKYENLIKNEKNNDFDLLLMLKK